MLSPASLERYRRMTPGERFEEMITAMNLAWEFLLTLPVEERNRRLDLAARQHREGNAKILTALHRIRD